MAGNEEKQSYLTPLKELPSRARSCRKKCSHNAKESWKEEEEVEQEFSATEVQEDVTITAEDIKIGETNMANWKELVLI